MTLRSMIMMPALAMVLLSPAGCLFPVPDDHGHSSDRHAMHGRDYDRHDRHDYDRHYDRHDDGHHYESRYDSHH